MTLLTMSSSLCKGLVLCFTLVTVFSFHMPYYSYSSTSPFSLDNTTMQLSNMSGNATGSSNVTSLSNLATNATISLTPNGSIVNLDLPESIVDLLGSEPPLADRQNNTGNLTVTNTTLVMTTNETQLSGTENVTVSANFSSKPFGLETDYSISGKPIIIVNDIPLNYEYMNDPADEVTVSDMLVALRASIKLDNSTASLPEQLRIFSNPSNVTDNSDGSKTYINDATTIDNLEIAGVIFSEATTIATIYPNGTGTLNSTNTL